MVGCLPYAVGKQASIPNDCVSPVPSNKWHYHTTCTPRGETSEWTQHSGSAYVRQTRVHSTHQSHHHSCSSIHLRTKRVLRAHGLCGPRLWEVARATAVSKLTYACSAWWGFADSSARSRIQAVMNKLARLGFLSGNVCFAQICQDQDNNLFSQILSNEHHVLHQLLPPVRNTPYSLRPRAHDRELPVASTTMRKNFIVRMLYSKL